MFWKGGYIIGTGIDCVLGRLSCSGLHQPCGSSVHKLAWTLIKRWLCVNSILIAINNGLGSGCHIEIKITGAVVQ